MKIALCPAAPTAARAARAAALARSAADPDAVVVSDHEGPEPAGPVAAPCVITLSECYDRVGSFIPMRLVRRLDALTPADRTLLVLDGTAGPMVTLDAHGNRAAEMPFHFLKYYFWGAPRPEVVVHFVPAHLMLFTAREWARQLYYPPVEATRSIAHEEMAARVAHMIVEMQNFRATFHPWVKFKRRLSARLAFWRR